MNSTRLDSMHHWLYFNGNSCCNLRFVLAKQHSQIVTVFCRAQVPTGCWCQYHLTQVLMLVVMRMNGLQKGWIS